MNYKKRGFHVNVSDLKFNTKNLAMIESERISQILMK